jgi:hypothetical protein
MSSLTVIDIAVSLRARQDYPDDPGHAAPTRRIRLIPQYEAGPALCARVGWKRGVGLPIVTGNYDRRDGGMAQQVKSNANG